MVNTALHLLQKQSAGLSDEHINDSALDAPVHNEAVVAIGRLKQAALIQGYDLSIASGFRCFDRQRRIWNEKAQGIRSILDSNGIALIASQLSDTEKLFAILRWSALPGASRHHWGSDFDIYDAKAMPPNYHLQLSVAETEAGGIFTSFYQWLDEYLAQPNCVFYRPYYRDTGGIAPEPWHLSYRPIASQYSKILTKEYLRLVIEEADIALKETILSNFDEIYSRFVALS